MPKGRFLVVREVCILYYLGMSDDVWMGHPWEERLLFDMDIKELHLNRVRKSLLQSK